MERPRDYSCPLPASQEIAASPLSLEPDFKSFHCTCLVFVELDPSLSWLANAAPLTDQGRLAKQAGFDRQDIVASHVAGMVTPVEHQVLDRVCGHASMLDKRMGEVQSKS